MRWAIILLILWVIVSNASFEFKLACVDDIESCYPDAAETVFNSMKNKHIVFIGDSLSRYQYLSLVYMLRHRNVPSMTMNPNIFEEHSPAFGNFNIFYQFTKGMLAPYEVCDCSRNLYIQFVSDCFENRYYRDPVHNITVTYLWYIFYAHGHWSFEQTLDTRVNSIFPRENLDQLPDTWNHTLCSLSTAYLSTFDRKPDAIVFNVGRWGQKLTAEHVACAVFDLVQVTDLAIWKTTTFSHSETLSGIQGLHILENDALIEPYEGTALTIMNTSWTGQLKDVKYYNQGDDMHFRANVYTVLNMQLMELVEARLKELAEEAE